MEPINSNSISGYKETISLPLRRYGWKSSVTIQLNTYS